MAVTKRDLGDVLCGGRSVHVAQFGPALYFQNVREAILIK